MIVVDTSGLLLLLDPSAKAPVDPNTKLGPVDKGIHGLAVM
jgi:hypothetical protein